MKKKINLIENLDNATILINFEGKIKLVNTEAKRMFSCTQQELLGSDLLKFFSAADQNEIKDNLADVINFKVKELKELILICENNKQVDLKLDLMQGLEEDLIKVAVMDTKNRLEIEEKMQILAEFPEKNPNPVLRLSKDGKLLYANSASKGLLRQLGVKKNEKIPADYQTIIDQVVKTNQSKETMVQSDEEIYLFSFAYYEEYDCVYLYGQDMTGLKQANEHIERLANYDSLSGLPNRNLFIDRLERLMIKAEEKEELVAVLFIDVDDFKKVNDTFGHQAGDKLITDVAKRLEDCLDKSDTIARLGGNQFGVIINGMNDLTKLNQTIERLMNKFKYPFIVYPDPFSSDGQEVFITISLGTALYPQDSNEVEQLIKNAEIAMHQVKKTGKNNYRFFSSEMNESFLHELELEAKLRRALDKDEFIVYYQPQINIEENKVAGIEALLRWDNEELGLVSPGDFIPLAERTGLILEIGNWVLKQACQETKELQEKIDKELKISINLSPRQFKDEELIAKIDNAIDESGLNPANLTLEITETIIMEDIERSVEILVELKERGIHISVDDFGTGYSSLNYLSSFPLDELKIDRSFIMDIPEDKEKISISKAVINLAHALDLNVIAEGAETYDQVKFLKENNCEQIQGYYYSKPVPKLGIAHFLEQKNALWGNSNEKKSYLAGIDYSRK